MNRYIRSIALCGALFIAMPAVYADTLVKVVDHPIATASKSLSLDDINRNITAAATKRGWTITQDGPQRLRAMIEASRGDYRAVVSITYSKDAFSITLVNSKGFHQEGDSINGRANRWIRNLEHDIDEQLARPV
jgi:hypothetical protein